MRCHRFHVTELEARITPAPLLELLRDVNPLTNGAAPGTFAEVNGIAYFAANDGVNGIELWRSDGTSAGTYMVRDLTPGSASGIPVGMYNHNGTLYFGANNTNGTASSDLWKSDGTSAGTVRIAPTLIGTYFVSPSGLTSVGSTLFFQASGSLWKSDGTAAGTVALKYLANPQFLTNVNGTLFCSGGTLFVSGRRSDVGVELLRLGDDSTAPLLASINSPSSNGVYTTGQSVTVAVNFSEPVALVGGNLTLNLYSGGTVTITPGNGATRNGSYFVQAGQTSADLTVTGVSLAMGATLKDAAGNSAVLTLPVSNLAQNASIIVNPLAPTTVSLVTINLGDPQRSRVTAVSLDFATPLNAAIFNNPGGVTLTRTSGGPPVILTAGSGLNLAPLSGNVTSIALSFTDNNGVEQGSLADGRWQLAIHYLQYSTPLNGTDLRRLFGDINGDLTVAGDDLVAFGNAFGTANTAFDVDGNGVVDGSDLVAFGNRFGMTV